MTEYLVGLEIDKDYNLILVQVDKNRMMIEMSRFYVILIKYLSRIIILNQSKVSSKVLFLDKILDIFTINYWFKLNIFPIMGYEIK